MENLKTLMLIYKQWLRLLMEAAVHKSSIDKWLLMRGGCLLKTWSDREVTYLPITEIILCWFLKEMIIEYSHHILF